MGSKWKVWCSSAWRSQSNATAATISISKDDHHQDDDFYDDHNDYLDCDDYHENDLTMTRLPIQH